MTTPETLLALAATLTEVSGTLGGVSTKLVEVAALLETEAANLAEEQAKKWGFEVQVAVGVKGGPGCGNGSEVVVKK
jgi:hypothetical protein